MARPSMREEILDAALERFRTVGYNAAGVKEITDGAGVPKGSFYNHFESKEALGVVALQRYGEGRRLGDLAASEVPPLVRLRRHFEFLRAETEDCGYQRGCLFGNFGAEVADHSDIIREAVDGSLAEWQDRVAALLDEARESGAVDPGLDARATAIFVVSAWEGTLITARAARSPEAFDAFFTLVFGTLLAQPSS
jgi:TetR/AcrR family transcriptional regulator, transcriptional repressor for nem operon